MEEFLEVFKGQETMYKDKQDQLVAGEEQISFEMKIVFFILKMIAYLFVFKKI